MTDGKKIHVPDPACPDAKAAQEVILVERAGRCPDGGYCHGQTFEAGSEPCEAGKCFRVQTSGPLSGVFPDDRWPDYVLLASGITRAVPPDGEPLRRAIGQALELGRVLGVAMGSRDGQEIIEAHLQMAAQLAYQIIGLTVQANRNLTGQEVIRYQGLTYAGDGQVTREP
jgi:hypothetical protein